MSGASGPGIRFRLPPLSLFKFPPDADPQILPPPSSESKFASPFPIDERIYNAALEPYIPVTIATVYFLLALQLNRINRKSSNRPWWISQTRLFFGFVILHNVFLAIFSGATFVAMLRALRHTWPSHREYPWMGILWPGLRTQNGFAGAADALCKMHGPRGFGDAASYNAVRGAWEVKNKIIKLAPDGRPDSTDVGRLWNEGLAFWGWWFYLSKFYEVVDTLIILMKGKRSSTLQVYHHMGAMLCMWAGIRYMSPPIWMFCFINSGIHTLMVGKFSVSIPCVSLTFLKSVRLLHTLVSRHPGAPSCQEDPHDDANSPIPNWLHLRCGSSLRRVHNSVQYDLCWQVWLQSRYFCRCGSSIYGFFRRRRWDGDNKLRYLAEETGVPRCWPGRPCGKRAQQLG